MRNTPKSCNSDTPEFWGKGGAVSWTACGIIRQIGHQSVRIAEIGATQRQRRVDFSGATAYSFGEKEEEAR